MTNTKPILAIDPGSKQSAWLLYDAQGQRILAMAIQPNRAVLSVTRNGIDDHPPRTAELAIEMVGHYGSGMSVGKDVFDTVRWIGRFQEAWEHGGGEVHLILRKTIAARLCGMARAKGTNIRQAIIDRFPATGGGTIPQIGTKPKPGPLYGVKTHLWSALAVALAWAELRDEALRAALGEKE